MKIMCDQCQKEFERKPSKINKTKNFCSRLCQENFNDSYIELKCSYCEIIFLNRKSKIKNNSRNYCCREHYKLGRIKTNQIIKNDSYAEILINSKSYGLKKVLIDLDDIDKVKDYTWCIANKLFYIETRINKKRILLHRFITDCDDVLVIDHINRNPLDNRKLNLRICNQSENASNRAPKPQSAGVSGIYFNKADKVWTVRPQINKVRHYLGSYKDLDDAKKVLSDFLNKNQLVKYELIKEKQK